MNHKYEIRKQFQERASACGINHEVVFIDTPKNERLKRREENVKQGDAPGRRIISLEQMQEFEDEFEAPTPEESAIILKTQQGIDEFIATL